MEPEERLECFFPMSSTLIKLIKVKKMNENKFIRIIVIFLKQYQIKKKALVSFIK